LRAAEERRTETRRDRAAVDDAMRRLGSLENRILEGGPAEVRSLLSGCVESVTVHFARLPYGTRTRHAPERLEVRFTESASSLYGTGARNVTVDGPSSEELSP
jgi:hypothetical protein